MKCLLEDASKYVDNFCRRGRRRQKANKVSSFFVGELLKYFYEQDGSFAILLINSDQDKVALKRHNLSNHKDR